MRQNATPCSATYRAPYALAQPQRIPVKLGNACICLGAWRPVSSQPTHSATCEWRRVRGSVRSQSHHFIYAQPRTGCIALARARHRDLVTRQNSGRPHLYFSASRNPRLLTAINARPAELRVPHQRAPRPKSYWMNPSLQSWLRAGAGNCTSAGRTAPAGMPLRTAFGPCPLTPSGAPPSKVTPCPPNPERVHRPGLRLSESRQPRQNSGHPRILIWHHLICASDPRARLPHHPASMPSIARYHICVTSSSWLRA